MTELRTPARPAAQNRIHEALRDVWRSCTSSAGDASVARALTMNFLGVGRAAEAPALRASLERLWRRQPCRAFLVTVEDAAQPIAVEVSGVARAHGDTRDIVLEVIDVRVPMAWFGNVAGLVRPLLINDLPTHLFWASSWPAAPRHFDALLELADHAVVDSGCFQAPAVELEALRQRQDAGRRITDLSWLRVGPWRRALAEVFERTPWQPGAPTVATIHHGRHPSAQAASVLLGRWLEQRLLAAVYLQETGDDRQGTPEAIELRHGEVTARASIAASGRIVVHTERTDACLLPFQVPLSTGSVGDLLAAAIDLA